MDQAPLVSIVIPMYNAAQFLSFTLDSVRAQTIQDFEVILFDDGSSDGTLQVAAEYASKDERIRVLHGNHDGAAVARNRGFAATHSGSEFIAFLDSDDIWENDALETLLQALRAQPECPAAHGLCRCIDSKGLQFPHDDHAENMRNRRAVVGDQIVPLPRSAPTSFAALLIGNYVTTPGTCAIRRSALQRVGGFKLSGPCEDWDFNLRLARLGDLAFVDQIVLSWRRHDTATSNVSARWFEGYIAARQRSINARDNTPLQRSAAIFALRSEVSQLQREAGRMLREGALRPALKKLTRAGLLALVSFGVPIPVRS